jgi:hypothetical protein
MADLFFDVILRDGYINLYKDIHFAVPAGDNADVFETRMSARLEKHNLVHEAILIPPLCSGESLAAAAVPQLIQHHGKGKGKVRHEGCHRCGGKHRAIHCYLADDDPIVLQRAADRRPTPPGGKGKSKSKGKGGGWGKMARWIPVAAGATGAAGQYCGEDSAVGGSPSDAGPSFLDLAATVMLVLGIIYVLLTIVEKVLTIYHKYATRGTFARPVNAVDGDNLKDAAAQTTPMSIWIYPNGAVYHTRKPCRELDRMERRPLCAHCKRDEYLI